MRCVFQIGFPGHPKISTTPECEILGAFLGFDWNDPDAVLELLYIMEQVNSGELSAWDGNSNDWTVILSPGNVTLEHMWIENSNGPLKCELSSGEFRLLLAGWARFLKDGEECIRVDVECSISN